MPPWKITTVGVVVALVLIIDFLIVGQIYHILSEVFNLSPLVILGIGIIIIMVWIGKFTKIGIIGIIIGIVLILMGLVTG